MSDHDTNATDLAAWAAGLQSAPPSTELRTQLLQRVAASAAAHASFQTVRREAGAWHPLAPGVQRRELRRDEQATVELLRVADGAALPPSADAEAIECLLIEGELHDTLCDTALPVRSHVLLPGAGAALAPLADLPWRARGPVLLYRRLLHVAPSQMPLAEARWWQRGLTQTAARQAQGQTPWQAPGPWVRSGPGVQVMPLFAQRHVVSMLVQFEAGARVPDHGHELDEDCLVLAGEMFLGDILLRAGDYQLAPAGGSHVNETSDVGVCFYFHGAIDDALRGPQPAQA
jgi:quercetin dioxygenase-like cupin family protein